MTTPTTHTPAAELEAKLDIALELEAEDTGITELSSFAEFLEDYSVMDLSEIASTASKHTITHTTQTAKGGKMKSQSPKKTRNYEILAAFIEKYPGVSRTDVFCHQDLLQPLRTEAQRRAIAGGDKQEIKRWNRRLNFLIREMRRQGVDVQIERKGRVAHYTIVPASGQLELPFTPAAEARNKAITGNVDNEVLEGPTPIEFSRANEEDNVMMDFDSLLATLDEEAVAPVAK